MAKKWRRGDPYFCNQCGRKCVQGIKHCCTKSLSFHRVVFEQARDARDRRLDAKSKEYNKRLADGFGVTK